MELTMSYPRFLYHRTHALEGKVVRTDIEESQLREKAEQEPEGDLWVDTPEKFDPNYQPPPPPAVAPGTVPEKARLSGFVPQPFPSVRYHRETLAERTVTSKEDLAALGPEWIDTPDVAAFDLKQATTDVAPTAPSAPVSATDVEAARKAAFFKATVSEIVTQMAAITDPAQLDTVEAFEAENPRGPRTTVLKAVKARRAELKSPSA